MNDERHYVFDASTPLTNAEITQIIRYIVGRVPESQLQDLISSRPVFQQRMVPEPVTTPND